MHAQIDVANGQGINTTRSTNFTGTLEITYNIVYDWIINGISIQKSTNNKKKVLVAENLVFDK